MATGAERLRAEAERIADDDEMSDTARRAAGGVKKAGEVMREAAGGAGKKAEKAYGEAKNYYDRASQFVDAGAKFTRASTAATAGVLKARDWIKENPGTAAVVTVSLVLGIRAGAAFPGLDGVLLGAHPHWLTHSALPVYGLRKAGEKFDNYLKKREELIGRGELDEAERERVEFERKIAKYVGAPLLGAFSCAAGADQLATRRQPISGRHLVIRERRNLFPPGLQILHDRPGEPGRSRPRGPRDQGPPPRRHIRRRAATTLGNYL
jgi:ElaB/YqjD/DUF883 family membrane-anchored ribosome-binding protein